MNYAFALDHNRQATAFASRLTRWEAVALIALASLAWQIAERRELIMAGLQ
jgi:hypothetical protein